MSCTSWGSLNWSPSSIVRNIYSLEVLLGVYTTLCLLIIPITVIGSGSAPGIPKLSPLFFLRWKVAVMNSYNVFLSSGWVCIFLTHSLGLYCIVSWSHQFLDTSLRSAVHTALCTPDDICYPWRSATSLNRGGALLQMTKAAVINSELLIYLVSFNQPLLFTIRNHHVMRILWLNKHHIEAQNTSLLKQECFLQKKKPISTITKQKEPTKCLRGGRLIKKQSKTKQNKKTS